MGLDLAGN